MSEALEYTYVNVGLTLGGTIDATEYTTVNVGIQAAVSRDAADYLTANVSGRFNTGFAQIRG